MEFTALANPQRIETLIINDRASTPELKPAWDEIYCLEYQGEDNVQTWSKSKCFNPTREQVKHILDKHAEPRNHTVGHPNIPRHLTDAEVNAYFKTMDAVNSFWNKRQSEQNVMHQILRSRYPNVSFVWMLGTLNVNGTPTKITSTLLEQTITYLEKTFGHINAGALLAEIIDTKLNELFIKS